MYARVSQQCTDYKIVQLSILVFKMAMPEYNFRNGLSCLFTLANTTAPNAYVDSPHTGNEGYQQTELNINIKALPMIMQVQVLIVNTYIRQAPVLQENIQNLSIEV